MNWRLGAAIFASGAAIGMALRGVYEEASEALGKEFKYPGD